MSELREGSTVTKLTEEEQNHGEHRQ